MDIREIQILSSISHQGIVRPLDTFKQGKSFYMCMQYYSSDLAHVVDRGTPLDFFDTVLIFKKIVESVEYLHDRGIMHRVSLLDFLESKFPDT